MKYPDKEVDRALQAALKRKFEAFETSVDKKSDDAIFNEMKAFKGQKSPLKTWLAGGVAALLLFVTLSHLFDNKLTKDKVTTAPHRKGSSENSKLLSHETAVYDSSDHKVISASITTSSIKKPDHKPNAERKISIKRSSRTLPPTSGELDPEYVKTSAKTLHGVLLKGSTVKENPKIADQNIAGEHSGLPHPTIQQTGSHLNINPSFEVKSLTGIERKPYLSVHVPRAQMLSETGFSELEKKKIKHLPRNIGFVLQVIPLNTSQVLTVSESPGVVYQNIRVPSDISMDKLGFKLTGGLTKGALQFVFSYGQQNQSFAYEIASNEFELKQKENKEWNFVPKGIGHQQNNTLRFIGLGVKRHAVIKKTAIFNNYFGDIGLEYSRELSSKSNVLWGNLAAGKQFPISKNKWIMVGPYLEYSFTRLVNPDTQFKIQPYQIGFSVGLKYGPR